MCGSIVSAQSIPNWRQILDFPSHHFREIRLEYNFRNFRTGFFGNSSCASFRSVLNARHHTLLSYGMASWRSGYAEDCKSLHPGSIPGEASIPFDFTW